MAVEMKNDGCLSWTYIGSGNKTHSRILWIVWLIVMLLLFSCIWIMSAVTGLTAEMSRFLQRIFLGVAGFVTAIFAFIWLWERFIPKKYSYSVDENKLTVAYGRYRRLPFDEIKGFVRRRERDAIILKLSSFSLEIFVADKDYEEVWEFLTRRCHEAECIR